MGGKFHPRLNIYEKLIVNKYREGKMKRTLKRGLKVPEIAEREAFATCADASSSSIPPVECFIGGAQVRIGSGVGTRLGER